MSKPRTEVVEMMVNSFQEKNKEMAAASGMTPEAIAEHVEQSNPSITFLLDAVYETLANEKIIQS
jgi:hypothetical protein